MQHHLLTLGSKLLPKSLLAIASATALLVSAASVPAANRTLILLQENSGRSGLDDFIQEPARSAVQSIVDKFAEGSEAAKFQKLANGHYQHFINLSDSACTRAQLLANLINESAAGYTIDLAILGHGNTNLLALHGEYLTGLTTSTEQVPYRFWTQYGWQMGYVTKTKTDSGSIRSLLSDAKAQMGSSFNFNLRLVSMCNCVASSLNDDWLAIGAQVSVGSLVNDYMPEPMTTFFWDNFVNMDMGVRQAASDAYMASIPWHQFVPGYNSVDPATGMTPIQESRLVVTGNGDLIFNDEYQLALNQSRTFQVQANRPYTLPGIYLVAGQKYSYSASGSWKSNPFAPGVNADGYSSSFEPRRYSWNGMSLSGERFLHNNAPLGFIGGSGFKIGANNTITATGSGYLALFPNDGNYLDNSGAMSVTVQRVQ